MKKMIKRVLIFVLLGGTAFMLLPLVLHTGAGNELNSVAAHYVTRGPAEVGAQNIVTAVIVTYRGLDTLGEVLVLFLATTGVGFVLRSVGRKKKKAEIKTGPSEILTTGRRILLPLIVVFGVYVFAHGHLTPGGGFQGGVIIATGLLLLLLSSASPSLNRKVLSFSESISGLGYVVLAILGLILAAGFLDSRMLPLGRYGSLISAGTIPLIYSLIGIKVGSELVSILDHLRRGE